MEMGYGLAYSIYMLPEGEISISGGAQLDGVTQGDGSHLVGETITLNSPSWQEVTLSDNDDSFGDNDDQRLDGEQTIGDTTYPSGTVTEAEFKIVLSDGENYWTVIGFNVNDSSTSYSSIEGLAFIGEPGEFPPVGVPLTVVHAEDFPNYAAVDYVTPICFSRGTLIETESGLMPVEHIEVGERVMTRDSGYQPVQWRGARLWPAIGKFAPILFKTGVIGNDRPLRLSPQHRVRMDGWQVELVSGNKAALVPALHMVNDQDIVVEEGGVIEYHHLMFDRHQIIYSEGAETESFHPGAASVGALDAAQRDELYRIFPSLQTEIASYGPCILPSLSKAEAKILRSM